MTADRIEAAPIRALLADLDCELYEDSQDCITAGPEVFAVDACTTCRLRAALAEAEALAPTDDERDALVEVLAGHKHVVHPYANGCSCGWQMPFDRGVLGPGPSHAEHLADAVLAAGWRL